MAEFHVLLTVDDTDVLSLHVERPCASTDDVAACAAALQRELESHIERARALRSRELQGDEEWNGAGFGDNADLGDGGGGGGFHVLARWTAARELFRERTAALEADVRGLLTGAQATARDPQAATPPPSVFAPSTPPTVRTGAVVVMQAALLLTGALKKEDAGSVEQQENVEKQLAVLLRTNALRKCVELDPKSAAKWTAVLRAASHLKTHRVAVQRLARQAEITAIAAASHAIAALLDLLASLTAVVRFLKHLQELARQRRAAKDATATVLQCCYRVVRAKRELLKRRRERRAAIAIQCAFRQHLARRKRLFLRWTHAATTVQRAFRRRQARRRGRKPRLLGDELRAIAQRFGGVQLSRSSPFGEANNGDGDDGAGAGGEWRVDMAAFDSFKAYLQSRAGREQLRREQAVLTTRMAELQQQREQRLDAHERLLADAHDVFELLDVEGSGELSRKRARELLTRLHVPLHDAEADDVLDMMDSDRSGAISFLEFSRWFTFELQGLRHRRRDCGVLSKSDRQWMAEQAARSALHKRWLAVQRGLRMHATTATTTAAAATEQ
ncbi:hypothetical protein PINS_up014112 [Pythium insidiosum]|nr:hypothetical protein PINS_up014112 [Pythium insidiosum]